MRENKGYEDRGRMSIATPFHGSLFANDFLQDSVTHLDDWRNISAADLDTLEYSVRDVFNGFPSGGSPNESQTEDDLIWPVLAQLGWTASLRQQNLSAHGREDVPDGLLFPDAAAKDRANSFAEEWKRYEFGLAVIESKRWGRPLDRRSGRRGEETAPSTQMLRYLRRVDDLTTGKLRWGILTNGARWRLYYQGARSVSEQFFEMDLAALLDLPGHNEGLFALTKDARRHWLKVFALVFRLEAFLAGPTDPRTFHQRAIEEGRFYEERVAANLSALVFGQVFPELASAIAAAAPEASLPEVREATLVLLYRLLFILYAEDRDLLPVRNTSYDDYALREKVRGDVRHRKDRGLSRPGESHPQPLQEPDVNLSAHPAPITQATKWLCYFQGLLLPSSWPLVCSRVTKPLRSAAITTASSLLRACPPLGNASILSASQVLCLCLSLSIVAPSSRSST